MDSRLALAASILALALACTESEPVEERTPAAAAAKETASPGEPVGDQGGNGRRASRRIAEGCDPIAESASYREFVGRRALVVLSWNDLSQRAADLEIPVFVHAIEGGAGCSDDMERLFQGQRAGSTLRARR